MPRPTRNDDPQALKARVPGTLMAELFLLEPSLVDSVRGGTRYGAMSSFITQLLRAYIDERHKLLKGASNK